MFTATSCYYMFQHSDPVRAFVGACQWRTQIHDNTNNCNRGHLGSDSQRLTANKTCGITILATQNLVLPVRFFLALAKQWLF